MRRGVDVGRTNGDGGGGDGGGGEGTGGDGGDGGGGEGGGGDGASTITLSTVVIGALSMTNAADPNHPNQASCMVATGVVAREVAIA